MSHTLQGRAAAIVTAASAMLLLGACQGTASPGGASSADGPAMDKVALEAAAAKRLATDFPSAPPVRCEGGLAAQENASQKCEAQRPDGVWIPYTVAVLAVDGNDLRWNILADDPSSVTPPSAATSTAPETPGATSISADKLAQRVDEALTRRIGARPVQTACPAGMPLTDGATQTCATQSPDSMKWYPVTVTIQNANGQSGSGDVAISVGKTTIPKPAYAH